MAIYNNIYTDIRYTLWILPLDFISQTQRYLQKMATSVNGNIPAIQCPKTVTMMKATSNGVFDGESPLEFALPLVILQICLVVGVTRSLAFLLRPLRQPRVVAEIIVSLFHLLVFRSVFTVSFRFNQTEIE